MRKLIEFFRSQSKREPRHILDNVYFEVALAFAILCCFVALFLNHWK